MPKNFGLVVLEQSVELFTREWDKASKKFLDDVWNFDWIGFALAVVAGGEDSLAPYVDRGFIILNSFLQDVYLVPVRVVGDLSSYAFPISKIYRSRVVRGDQAFATFVTEFVDIGLDVATFNWTGNSGLVFYGLRLKKWISKAEFFVNLTERSVLKLGKTRLLTLVTLLLKVLFVTCVATTVLVIVYTLWQRFNDPEEEPRLLSHMLPQDSERKRLLRPKRFEVRLNKRAGRDK